MKLYNSLTKKIEDFKPTSKTIGIYSCGPTVYNNLHIGNLSAFIYADLLRRALVANFPDHSVHHVMNITDVDDKTIRDSKGLDVDPMVALKTLTKKYDDVFRNDMRAIGNDVEAIDFINATDSIEDMLNIIHALYDQGFAYIADDGVYFSISAYQDSGKKYGQLVHIDESSTSASRIQNDEYDKESAHDFALWKVTKAGEPSWPFELNGKTLDGRPGWHIECSAMSKKLLGQPFDIHTGGIDLKFPHHENEIAQSTATTSDPTMARFFVHNEHVLVDGKKMSKSLNNFYTLNDLLDKDFEPIVFRLLVLHGHYRSAVGFSWENLDTVRNILLSWRRVACLRWQTKREQMDELVKGSATAQMLDAIKNIMSSDLKTSACVAYINEHCNNLDSYVATGMLDHEDLLQVGIFFEKINLLLGLNLLESTPNIANSISSLLHERTLARGKSDYSRSDQIRLELADSGIHVLDTPSGQIWSYV